MTNTKESGRYSLAGFLYQLLASGIEVLSVCEGADDSSGRSGVFVIERFGQDLAFLPEGNGDGNLKLIQYKFSSVEAQLHPSDFREILQVFLKSVAATGLTIAEIDFVLVSNRNLSDEAREFVDAKKLPDGGDLAKLEKLLCKRLRSELENVSELAQIFRRMRIEAKSDVQLRDKVDEFADSYGVLPDEVESRTNEVVGLLLRESSKGGSRQIDRFEICKAFTGFPNPYELLGEDSIRKRIGAARDFRDSETENHPTIPRSVASDIARATIDNPLVVVVGDGGCGKSVAAATAVEISLADNTAPGFAMIHKALDTDPQTLMRTIASWRNQVQHVDGDDLDRSINRLRRAFHDVPTLALHIDAIDEKAGSASLPNRQRSFIRNQIRKAIDSKEKDGIPSISVVITCRRLEELRELGGGGFPFQPAYYEEIRVGDFDEFDVQKLSGKLTDDVSYRIRSHLDLRGRKQRSFSPGARPVSSTTLKVISHPVMWRFFAGLRVSDQHACLDENAEGLESLADAYLDWYCRKVALRKEPITANRCMAALTASAISYDDKLEEIGTWESNWKTPCMSAGCDISQVRPLFDEAISVGLFGDEEKDQKHPNRWRWKHPWLGRYLSQRGVV